MLSLLTFFLVFSSHAEPRVLIPKEVLSTVLDEFPSTASLKPVYDDISVIIEGEKTSHTAKVGISQPELDLVAFVGKNAGNFTLRFQPPFEITPETQLFFINRYRPLADKKHGGGMECGKALRIQKHLDELFTTQGVKFMTKDGAYLNVLGGDFLLAKPEEHQLRVVYFKITDGRYSSRLCNKSAL
jgi:hypothetical protein